MGQSIKIEDEPADHYSQSTDHQLGTSNAQTVSNHQTLRLSPEPKGERRREKGHRRPEEERQEAEASRLTPKRQKTDLQMLRLEEPADHCSLTTDHQ